MPQEKISPSVRRATLADAAELARMIGYFDNQPLSIAQMAARMAATQGLETAFLAFWGEKSLGMACLRLAPALSAEKPQAEVTELFIERGYQGGEIEQALLEQVEKEAKERGAEQIILFTGLQNTAAQLIYRSLGYRDYVLAMRKLLNISHS